MVEWMTASETELTAGWGAQLIRKCTHCTLEKAIEISVSLELAAKEPHRLSTNGKLHKVSTGEMEAQSKRLLMWHRNRLFAPECTANVFAVHKLSVYSNSSDEEYTVIYWRCRGKLGFATAGWTSSEKPSLTNIQSYPENLRWCQRKLSISDRRSTHSTGLQFECSAKFTLVCQFVLNKQPEMIKHHPTVNQGSFPELAAVRHVHNH